MTVFLDFPADAFDAEAGFWAEVTGSSLSAARGAEGEFATLLPSSGDDYLRVQRVSEPSGGCHLDLHLDPLDEPLDDVVAQAVALGARVLRRDDDLVVLDSPGGFTFCLVRWEGEVTVPRPIELDAANTGDAVGGLARLDQLCLDIPPDEFESECAFWAALTGWELRSGSMPQFWYLVRENGMPIRVLFQRRDVADPGDRVTAHPDFACADVVRLTERHVAAGARIVAPFANWITLADPTELAYCLTRRDPETGTLH
jgi:predicted enzyme related to lactoylglutathione lyase